MTEYIHVKRSEKKHHGHQHQNGQGFDRAAAARGEFPFTSINGFKLIDVEYRVPEKSERERMRSQFKSVRAAFLREIGKTHEKELRAIGMNDAMIQMVKEGRTPNGYNVHHKLPIHGGGKNEFSNFILIPIPPHDELHHRVLDPQVAQMQTGESKMVKLPWSDDMVYVPQKDKTKTAVLTKLAAAKGR